MMDLSFTLAVFFGLVCCATAILVITKRNPVFSALFLVLNFASLAGLYLVLNAQFIAVVQVIVYAGAIMVLFLFVIMLLKPENEKKFFAVQPKLKLYTLIVAIIVFIQFLFTIFIASAKSLLKADAANGIGIGTIEAIGTELYTKYLLSFEAIAFLLLAATIGAILLAKKRLE
jgi:NADH-quinone oxidoreductase subunit J